MDVIVVDFLISEVLNGLWNCVLLIRVVVLSPYLQVNSAKVNQSKHTTKLSPLIKIPHLTNPPKIVGSNLFSNPDTLTKTGRLKKYEKNEHNPGLTKPRGYLITFITRLPVPSVHFRWLINGRHFCRHIYLQVLVGDNVDAGNTMFRPRVGRQQPERYGLLVSHDVVVKLRRRLKLLVYPDYMCHVAHWE